MRDYEKATNAALADEVDRLLDKLDTAETFIRRMGMEYRYQEFINATRGDTNK
jgi:hypothetical protein